MSDADITKRQIDTVDRRAIYRIYEDWPKMARQAWESTAPAVKGRFRRVAFLALGGSAAAGDIISDWMLSVGGLEFSVFKGDLPNIRMDDVLVIACSASGNTYETLEMAKAARNKTGKIVVVSSGGLLRDFARRNGLPHFRIPLMVAPRYTLSYALFASLSVLREASMLGRLEAEVDGAIDSMRRLSKGIAARVHLSENRSKQLATRLAHSWPKIYGTSVTKGVATRLKSALNENAKMHASVASSPELFHNEVESWEIERGGRFLPVFLRHGRESESESGRMEDLRRILASAGVRGEQVAGSGRSSLSQLVTLAYVTDFAAYYTAIVRGVDPYQIGIIDRLKSLRFK